MSKLVCLIVTMVFALVGGVGAFAQCGVYLKHKSTQFLPYQRVHLESAADMNGDGKADLIAMQNEIGEVFSRDRILVFFNDGTGKFSITPTLIDPPSGVRFSYNYLVGKVNGDAANDIIAYPDHGGGQNPATVLVYLNNGNGTFAAPVVSTASARGTARELADISGDGMNDYIGFNGNVFSYSPGNGDGTFGPPIQISNNDGIATSLDFNFDGKLDFVNVRRIYINNGNGTFTSVDMTQYVPSNEVPYIIRDLNSDARPDILVYTNDGWRRMLRRVDGGFDSTTYPFPQIPVALQPYFQIGHFNGDAYIDVMVTFRLQNKKILFALDATGAPTRIESDQRFHRHNYLAKVFADFDGDGREEVVEMTSGITNSNILLPGVTMVMFHKNVCDRPGQTRIIDYDATGNTDFSFWSPLTGEWTWRAVPYDNETNLTESVTWGLGSHGDIPTPGDFDGDGITDRAVFRNNDGYWYIRKSSDASWFVMRFGLPGDKPVVGDYDGDTISDIAVWRPSDGNWYFWYMGTQQFSAMHFGLDGDKPVPADYDGDLTTDVAVYRPSTGVWYYMKSSTAAVEVVRWGISEDKPMPADFDGDGKADFNVMRESNRFFYILGSRNGSAFYYFWGNPGDVLQIGDYNGDYLADLGLYRPSIRGWVTTVNRGGVLGADSAVPVSSTVLPY